MNTLARTFGALVIGLQTTQAFATQAQPVPVPEDQSTAPQINIAAVGIATAAAGVQPGTPGGRASIDFSDSAIQLGAAQRLYGTAGIGSLGIGGLTLDESNSSSGTSFFIYQAFTDFQTESFEALVGRSDNATAHLVDFPTLRGDDLITLTNPLNPFSNGDNLEEHRYATLGSVTFNQGLKYFENVHAQQLIDSAGTGSGGKLNSFGVTLEYLSTPGMEAFQRVVSWGVGYEHLSVNQNASNGLHQIYGGGVMNLNQSVTNRWELRVQDIVSLGSELREFSNVTDTYQAASNALAMSVRYLDSPFGRPGYQLALTAGVKNYFKVDQAMTAGFAVTGVKRLGQGFDLVIQYLGQWRDSSLATAQEDGLAYQQVAQLGFVFNFDATFNRHISPRRSILNQQFQYIPN